MSQAKMIRKRRHGTHDEGYWPGYVDALVNVVLNLMFLVAMLAVGSFVLGIQLSRQVIVPVVTTSLEKVSNIIDEVQHNGTEGSSNTIEVIDAPAPKTLPSVRLDRMRNIENQTLLHVKFAANALQLTDSMRVDLTPRLRELMQKNPGASFVVWTVSDAEPQTRRVSFMRIMALREALNRAGIENSRIETRILPGSSTTAEGQLVYVLMRPTQQRKESDEQQGR